MSIDRLAVIDSKADIDESVTIGPYSVIGPNVSIAANTWIGPHVVINGPTKIGANNQIFQFSSIGEIPQDKKFHNEKSFLEIGEGNTIREFVTINRGTEHGGGITKVGNNNWLMAYIHIAHDCIVGNNVVFSNNATLAGHVTIGNGTILGGFTLVHQFCAIGNNVFTAMGSSISKDVPPYLMVSGTPAHPCGINSEGLKRLDLPSDVVKNIKTVYKHLYRTGLSFEDAKKEIEKISNNCEEVKIMYDFLQNSKRSILR
ncbi:Acyl-[acyl-carrier-protein]--UDP-N-acetylglucosamine O-acyltransferase [hydrothermal vent metagenome]|uniref:Acyl-[acyl-carrier-protein]--UDP-N-acetylglucosamine O-acyltransferase n=1 Tax=hydrothermal vent metagenome TaxID=652676 RepID=A0A3B0ZVZ7_9ZZZZ